MANKKSKSKHKYSQEFIELIDLAVRHNRIANRILRLPLNQEEKLDFLREFAEPAGDAIAMLRVAHRIDPHAFSRQIDLAIQDDCARLNEMEAQATKTKKESKTDAATAKALRHAGKLH